MSQSWRSLSTEHLGQPKMYRRRFKKLDPGDFVEVLQDGLAIEICHFKCFGKVKGFLAFAENAPAERWTARSLKLQQGGIPLRYELDCMICNWEDKDWKYVQPKVSLG